MPEIISDKLIIAISSSALFDLETSNQVFIDHGIKAYANYQIEHETDILAPGVAFHLVEKFLNINQYADLVEVVLLSRNSADTGLRIMNSIRHYQLDITRAAFTNGERPHRYARAFGASLFLSTNAEDVHSALRKNIASAIILSGTNKNNYKPQLRIAFDGDAVIFSDEAERIFQQSGIQAFRDNEVKSANKPLGGGPFRDFLSALHHLQSQFSKNDCPIRTALVTAREAPAHERVIHTLRDWHIRIDEALFLGGLEKSQFLKEFGADIFFDDQKGHCEAAKAHVATGHVPSGVTNE